jgi:hypothetical protein
VEDDELGSTCSMQGRMVCYKTVSDEICDLLGYYAAYSGNSLPTLRDSVSVPERAQISGRKTVPETKIMVGRAVSQSFDVGPSSLRAVRIWCSDRLTAGEILVRAVQFSPLCTAALHPCLLYLPLTVYNFGSCQRC